MGPSARAAPPHQRADRFQGSSAHCTVRVPPSGRLSSLFCTLPCALRPAKIDCVEPSVAYHGRTEYGREFNFIQRIPSIMSSCVHRRQICMHFTQISIGTVNQHISTPRLPGPWAGRQWPAKAGTQSNANRSGLFGLSSTDWRDPRPGQPPGLRDHCRGLGARLRHPAADSRLQSGRDHWRGCSRALSLCFGDSFV